MSQLDLFDVGDRLIESHAVPNSRKRTCTAAPVGSGPPEERCGTCRFKDPKHSPSGRRFLKCGLVPHFHTHGAGSDIKARWQACREWRPNHKRQMQLAEMAPKDWPNRYLVFTTLNDPAAILVMADMLEELGDQESADLFRSIVNRTTLKE